MIETLSLRNYKGHTDTTLTLAPFTLLVGENACGKTSVLDLLHDVSRAEWSLSADVLRRGATELSLSIEHRVAGGAQRIDARFSHRPGAASLTADAITVTNETDALGRRPHVVKVALDVDALAQSSAPRTASPALGPRGEGIASVLAHLYLTDTPRFHRIVERLRAVVPIVRDVTFARVPKTETVTRMLSVEGQQVPLTERVEAVHDALRFHFLDAANVPSSQVSEGTLLALGLLTALETVERRGGVGEGGVVSPVQVVCIDDLDRALHPRAQRALLAALREVQRETPGLQIVATSHSPYLVDEMALDEVIVLGRNAAGVIVAKRLDDFPDSRLRAMLSAGELWMSEGDRWVTQ